MGQWSQFALTDLSVHPQMVSLEEAEKEFKKFSKLDFF